MSLMPYQRENATLRKSDKKLGDDVTFSRFVKITKSERAAPPVNARRQPKQAWLPNLRHKVLEEGRSIFFRKGVKAVADVKNVLVSGHNNVKIGRDVRKGAFRGYWIYTLSLEERATCPRSCQHWQSCYGNNMPYAKRIAHDDRYALKKAIDRDVVKLMAVRGRAGILIRLHALGDFYDEDYVVFWGNMLRAYPRLAVYGYTARQPGTPIGDKIKNVKRVFGRRFAIRWSDGNRDQDCTVSIELEKDAPANAFVCPEQTGKTKGCGTCGACWEGVKNVAFITH